jgi:alpha-amylase/alpha-mannosidase (GH57 family)
VKRPLCVAILWHMHQPEYGNVQTGEIYLPWTRFHAAKDYYDMAALAAEEPELHLTLNVVPSLMDQLVAYSSGAARETYASLTLRDASELDARERAFLLRTFFQLPWRFMLEPYARYAQLADRRGSPDEHGEYTDGLKRYSDDDYRDLQTWFNLAWCGRELRRRPEIADLFEKGHDFSEEEKRRVIEAQFRFAGEILPFYGRLAAEGRIELSCSPYYHPILPLLCDTASAREAIADLPLPAIPFAHPRDARRQIADAAERCRREFGRVPAGMWPSEGALSDAALALAAEEGLRWLASDEGVLLQSFAKNRGAPQPGPGSRYSAHRWGTAGPDLFFRDHGISDLIGFTYSGWAGVDAAADLLARLRQIHAHLPADGRHYVVPIILDGENAWEHYPDNGAEFLRAFYRGLTHTSELRSVTFSEFLELETHRERLPTITAGSWIGSSLTTWIGHPEKNRAWELLACARAFLAEFDGAEAPEAQREMSIAEGSDWFWWYGDDHHTQNAAEFDALFRSHVKNVYLLSGRDYPADLDVPIKRVVARGQCRAPVHTITPTIDGLVTHYFEWLPAGYALPSRGSMHRAESPLKAVYFGYDAERLYLRLDPAAEHGAPSSARRILVQFASPRDRRLELSREESGRWRCGWADGAAAREPQFAADRILELALPLADLGIERTGELRFFVAVTDDGRPIERLPEHGFLITPVDPAGLDHHEWVV